LLKILMDDIRVSSGAKVISRPPFKGIYFAEIK